MAESLTSADWHFQVCWTLHATDLVPRQSNRQFKQTSDRPNRDLLHKSGLKRWALCATLRRSGARNVQNIETVNCRMHIADRVSIKGAACHVLDSHRLLQDGHVAVERVPHGKNTTWAGPNMVQAAERRRFRLQSPRRRESCLAWRSRERMLRWDNSGRGILSP